MTAYKFLAKGAIGPISGHPWPTPRGALPGPWVEVEGALALCSRGVHVLGPFDLAHWLHEELWEVESEGDRVEGIDCFVVRRARLVRRIDVWSAGGAARFAEACIEHAAALSESNPIEVANEFIDDAKLAANGGYFAVSAFCSALAAANVATEGVTEQAYLRERRWQSDWIMREVIAPRS